MLSLCAFADLLDRQAGIITRAQLLSGGARQHDLERWIRRNELRQVLRGVYVNHTSQLSWLQRAWTAVLWAQPAALAWSTAVRAGGGTPTLLPPDRRGHERIHLLVGSGRVLNPPPWIVLHRCQAVVESTLWVTTPPRQRPEEAALDLAVAHLRSGSRNAHVDAVASLAEPIRSRRTTADRMLAAVERRARVHQRTWVGGVIADVAAGATSVLEQGFVRLVERPHALPPALRQVQHETVSGTVVRDTLFLGTQVVELDGRAFHDGATQRNTDLERDLDAAVIGLDTTRLGWGQVFDRPCTTAGKVGSLLVRRGWRGTPTPCRPGCLAPEVFRAAA